MAPRTYQDQSRGMNYGFVEYDDPAAAERAMSTLNGRRIHTQVRLDQCISHSYPHF